MINSISRFVLTYTLLVALQILLFNNIQFSGYVNPYVYLLLILLLPFKIQPWVLLLFSFGTGLIIDIFTASPGMHSSATVLAGFVRPFVLRIISPRDGYDTGSAPSMLTFGFAWFFTYTLVMVIIHHTALFYLEVFRFTDFFRTLLRVILGSAFSIAFILLIEYYRRGK
jgi:rod shape-determining protein MreD